MSRFVRIIIESLLIIKKYNNSLKNHHNWAGLQATAVVMYSHATVTLLFTGPQTTTGLKIILMVMSP